MIGDIGVLVVTADDDRVAWIEWALVDERVELWLARNGEEGTAFGKSRKIELILVDPRLPDTSGPELLQKLRVNKVRKPVVVVSDEAGVAEMSRGFGFGADAYVTVPSGGDDLVALLYRLTGRARKPPFIVKAGKHTLEFNERWMKIDGERVCFLGCEKKIVELLARRRGEIFSTIDLLDHFFPGPHTPRSGLAIDRYILRARKAMSSRGCGHDFIETVWGKGYRFREPTAAS